MIAALSLGAGPLVVAGGAAADPAGAGNDPVATAPTAPNEPSAPAAPAAPADPVVIVHVASPAAVPAALHRADRQPGVSVRHDFGALSSFSVRIGKGTERAAIAHLAALPGVTAIEKPVVRTLSAAPTDDPGLNHELSYLNAVNAPKAWAQQKGSAAIRIGIVDSGIDVTHEDLKNKIDATYNAVDHSASVRDTIGHGTFVAGVAAAQTNNAVGVAGAGYDTRILAAKITDSDGYVSIDDEVAGIKWAASHGANIINLSLGGPDSSATEKAAVQYAQQRGVLVVAAAGNDGGSAREYPAAYPGVIAVGATEPSAHARAAFSNYGSWVTLGAPGVGIYSTVPKGVTDYFDSPTGYDSGDGTSFATPIVAGEAALLKAQNPAMSLARLRAAVVASAHGYARQGIGAGQVDFALGLAHVPPTSTPDSVVATGTSDVVTLTANTTAPTVAFRLGTGKYTRPVTAVTGQATVKIATWGYANGAQAITAVDCTAYGECGYSHATGSVTLANAAPQITSPASNDTVTGLFAVRASRPGGGAVRLLLDGHPVGFDPSAPYSFQYSASSLRDGAHTLQARLCSPDATQCAGPLSAPTPVVAAGLHPRVRSLAPLVFSPNHDGRRDTSTLSYTLPDTETVQARIYDNAHRLVRASSLGSQRAGTHQWTWNGKTSRGGRLRDGTYTLALATTSGARRGWVTHNWYLDTTAPTLAHPTGANVRFYPVHDGYRDEFRPTTVLGDRGRLTLTVTDSKGHRIRTIAATRARGRASIAWNGHDSHGHRARPGTYHWTLTVADSAGNTRHTGSYRVYVSSKRLVTTTVPVNRRGSSATSAGASAKCAYARRRASWFAHGLRLSNGCAAAGYDIASANYSFAIPAAIHYRSLKLRAYGYSVRHPSEITSTVQRTDGGFGVSKYVPITKLTPRWYTLATVSPAVTITSHHRVHATIILDSTYPHRNDFDICTMRLLVSMDVLR